MCRNGVQCMSIYEGRYDLETEEINNENKEYSTLNQCEDAWVLSHPDGLDPMEKGMATAVRRIFLGRTKDK